MPNGTYGGVRGKETKVGQKTFVSRPTRLFFLCRVFGDGGPAYVCLCVLKTLRRFLMVKMAYEWKKKLIFAAENRVCHEQNAAIGWIAEV